MKILLTSELYSPTINGVVHSLLVLKDELTKQGHDVRVLTLGKADYYWPKEKVYYCSSLSLNKVYPGARIMIKQDEAIMSEILIWQPDIIHSQSEFSTFRLAIKIAKYLNIPLVHTYHTVYEDYTHYISSHPSIGRKIVRILSRYVARHADCLIAPTEKLEGILESYGIHTRTEVIPSAIHFEKITHPHSRFQLEKLEKRLGLTENDFSLVYIGRLAQEKNIQELIHYINKLSNKNLRLILVGDGPYRHTLENLCQELGLNQQVIFIGMVPADQVSLYYQIADIFVSASTSETQGLTYIEAMANAKAVLCRKDACLDKIVQQGQTGFQYESYEEFKKYLKELKEDKKLRQEIGQAAYHYVKKNYTEEAFASHILRLYTQLLKKHKLVPVS